MTAFCALTNNELLLHHQVHIEIGRHKNSNKNPESEQAIQELEAEILKQDPLRGAIIDLTLTLSVLRLKKNEFVVEVCQAGRCGLIETCTTTLKSLTFY